LLERSFPDLVTPYKQHFLVDLKKVQDRRSIRKQHHRKARKALKTIAIEQVSDPSHALDDWVRLYSHLVRKHSIFGLTAFSRSSFALQLRVPGLVLFMAREDEEAVAATLWFVDGGRAYYHLGASSERGYRACASFALFEVALDQFAAKGLEVVLLGAGAGVYDRGSDGLTRFKAGWATGTRQSYLCGRILSPPVYKQLNSACAGPTSSYFPPYRAHEHAPDAFSPPHYQS
jgi:predicted N-acyltransferase